MTFFNAHSYDIYNKKEKQVLMKLFKTKNILNDTKSLSIEVITIFSDKKYSRRVSMQSQELTIYNNLLFIQKHKRNTRFDSY